MNVGMLWFDNDPKAGLDKKVERAAAYYRDKYGKTPTLCFVHPSMFPGKDSQPGKNGQSDNGQKDAPATPPADRAERYVAAGVEVRGNRSVLPNHLWIGINTPA